MLIAYRVLITVILCLPIAVFASVPVKLQLNWLHQFEFAGYYAAVEKGFYRQAGLDVSILEGGPQIDSAQAVINGQADFGVGSSGLVIARSKGSDLVSLGVIIQHSPAVLLTLRSSGITSLKDFSGKRLMDSPNAGDVVAMLKQAGVDYEKLNKVTHQGSPAELISGKADAMIAYSTNEPFVLEERGVPYRIFSARGAGIDFTGDNFFTSGEMIRRNVEAVRGFREATLKGWEYALTHQEEIVDLILAKYSQSKSRAALLFEANQTHQLIQPELIELGYQSKSRWDYIAAVYEDIGLANVKSGVSGLVFDPTPPPDTFRFWISIAGFSFACLVLGYIAITLFRLNKRLHSEVAERKQVEHTLREHRDHLDDLVRAQTYDLVHAKEVAEAANQAKDQFLTNISHELRTPLHHVLSFAQIGLERTTGTPELIRLNRMFENINVSGKRMESLVADLLDLSQSYSESGKSVFKCHDLRELCQKAMLAEVASATGKQITLFLEEGQHAPALCDSGQIVQMLRYLIANAIKYSPPLATIQLAIQRKNGIFSLTVSDQGPGIPEKEIESIFAPFVQGSHTANGSGGKGLGLAVCRQIITRHGGTIHAYNGPLGGAVFEVVISEVSTSNKN